MCARVFIFLVWACGVDGSGSKILRIWGSLEYTGHNFCCARRGDWMGGHRDTKYGVFVFLCGRAAAAGHKTCAAAAECHGGTKYARPWRLGASLGLFSVSFIRVNFLLAFFGFAGVDFVFAGRFSKNPRQQTKRQQNLAGVNPENTISPQRVNSKRPTIH
jgi:hypothetical protein